MTYFKRAILSVHGLDLLSDQFQDPIYNRFKAWKNFVVCKRYTSFFNIGFGKFCFNAGIYHPTLPVVLETELDSILKIHSTRVRDPGDSTRAIRQLQFAEFRTKTAIKILLHSR